MCIAEYRILAQTYRLLIHYTKRLKKPDRWDGKEEKEEERIPSSNQPNIPNKGITPYKIKFAYRYLAMGVGTSILLIMFSDKFCLKEGILWSF